MTGREKIEKLIRDIQNEGSALRGKLSQLGTLRGAFAQSNADTSSVNVAITEYLTKTEAVKNDLIAKIDVATKKARDAQSQVVEMQNSPVFQEFLSEAEGHTDIEATPTYRSLKRTARLVLVAYLADVSFKDVAELDALIKDALVIANAQDRFNRMVTSFSVSETSKKALGLDKAEDEFYSAINDLSTYASSRTTYGIGGVLMLVGIAMVAAALAIACPPAGALAIGLLAGGAAVTAGGMFTLFAKAAVDSKNPLLKIGTAILDEESQVRALRS